MKKIDTINEFKELVTSIEAKPNYKKPLGFGICLVDYGQKNTDTVLQATFPVINWKENDGSAAVFIESLLKSGKKLDFEKSEQVFTIDESFLINASNYFQPFMNEAKGKHHKNVQVIKFLANFESDIKSAEAKRLKSFKEKTTEENLAAIQKNMQRGSMFEKIKKNKYKIVFIFDNTKPESVEAVYLKLYALSQKKAALRSLDLNGAFKILQNVAWEGRKPWELEYLRENEIELKFNGTFPNIDSVDKFPRFLQHIIPDENTRILESSKVRMGAQLAAGTTVMPGASYINFNAGTLGPVMVEGRISSSAIVGKDSDIGGGASILGVLSGTDGNPITIGENCLLGANSVCGIPLGNGCIIDAGIAILAGTRITIYEQELLKIMTVNKSWNHNKILEHLTFEKGKKSNEISPKDIFYIFKGIELAGLNGLHFRQDSIKGKILCKKSTKEIQLNTELH